MLPSVFFNEAGPLLRTANERNLSHRDLFSLHESGTTRAVLSKYNEYLHLRRGCTAHDSRDPVGDEQKVLPISKAVWFVNLDGIVVTHLYVFTLGGGKETRPTSRGTEGTARSPLLQKKTKKKVDRLRASIPSCAACPPLPKYLH